MKNTYRILLQVLPGVILGEEIEFDTPHGKYVFDNIKDHESECVLGLKIVAIIADDSLESAMDRARSFTDGFLLYLSYLSRTSIPRPDIIKGYEITANKQTGEFRQFYYDWQIPSYSSREVETKDIDKIIAAIKNGSDELRSSRRAIHWYREGVQSSNNLDTFISFFIGLETLNSMLRDRYNLPVEYNKCSGCGKQSGFPTLNGMREHIKTLYPGENYWKRIRNLRNDIIHGEIAFSSILNEAIEMIPIMENSLLKALDLFFGVESHDYNKSEALTNKRPLIGSIIAVISGPNLIFLKEQEPDISAELKDLKTLYGRKAEADIHAIGKISSNYSFKIVRIDANMMGYYADLDLKLLQFTTE